MIGRHGIGAVMVHLSHQFGLHFVTSARSVHLSLDLSEFYKFEWPPAGSIPGCQLYPQILPKFVQNQDAC